jgi:hypothetical protein
MKYNQRNWINLEASKNGVPIRIRVIEKMDPIPRYSCLMVVAYSFDNQSDPVSVLERVEQMEIELDREFTQSDIVKTSVITRPSGRTFEYYCLPETPFMEVLNRALSKFDKLPITVNCYDDAQWDSVRKIWNQIRS